MTIADLMLIANSEHQVPGTEDVVHVLNGTCGPICGHRQEGDMCMGGRRGQSEMRPKDTGEQDHNCVCVAESPV